MASSFDYTARGARGEVVKGTVSGFSAEAVTAKLQKKGLKQVKVTKVKERGGDEEKGFKGFSLGPPVKTEELILFCRQMGTLLKAGVPIVRALKGMVEMTPNKKLAAVLKNVVNHIEGGREFHSALQLHPKVFSNLFVSMVQIGESSGHLDDSFLQIGQYIDQEKQTADQVKSAMRYPTFVIMAMGGAMAVLTLFVIPTFEKVFAGAGAQLPLATRILMATSLFAKTYWLLILSILLGLYFGFKYYIKTPVGEVHWGRIKMKLPLVGTILQRATLTRFSRSLAIGLSSGVPLVESMKLTGNAVDNAYVSKKLDEMCNSVERGETLMRSAANTGLFTPLVLQMLAVGEETGMVDQMLREVSDFYEREVAHDLKGLTSAIEPILVVFMGVMVLTLALGIFMPMWDLSTAMKR